VRQPLVQVPPVAMRVEVVAGSILTADAANRF